jgi:hypothetical protein
MVQVIAVRTPLKGDQAARSESMRTKAMKLGKKKLRVAAACGVALLALAAPATGQRQSLAMLDGLEGGRWELRVRTNGRETERLCVSNGRRFIQLRHPDAACDRFVVEDQPNAVTVQYTCRGRGYGRTEIRRETSRLVQIQSQGIVGGLPFDFTAEARRVGDCGA